MTAPTATAACPVCDGPGTPERRFGDAPLQRCEACTFVFLDGAVDVGLYGDDYFEAYAGGDYLAHEHQRRHESRKRLDLLARVTPAPARLLEVGAAAGFFLAEARERGYDGYGVEPNAAMARHARDVLGVAVHTGVLADSAAEPGSFDAACAFHVVEHLEDPVGELRRVREVLRPGGHLLVEVPNAQSAAAARQGPSWAPLDLPYHVGQHGPRSLRVLLERAGFEVGLVDTVPFAFYAARSRPEQLLRGAVEAFRSGAPLPAGPHPHGHQLLRAVARRPADG